MKRFLVLLIACAMGLTVGFALAPAGMRLAAEPSVVHANWASQARTVPEVAAEADIIVRVQVDKAPKVRKLKQWLPLVDTPEKKFVANIMPFTDTPMQVVEVYKGTADKHITVMQTGGTLLAADGDPAMNIVTEDDPIFVQGSEHVLFLKNISGDAVHGKGRTLYVIVNPAGRYAVEGTHVFSPAHSPEGFRPPTTLSELVSQIQQALRY